MSSVIKYWPISWMHLTHMPTLKKSYERSELVYATPL